MAQEIRNVPEIIHTTSSLECNRRERSGLIRLSMAFVEESDIGTYSLRYFIFSIILIFVAQGASIKYLC